MTKAEAQHHINTLTSTMSTINVTARDIRRSTVYSNYFTTKDAVNLEAASYALNDLLVSLYSLVI